MLNIETIYPDLKESNPRNIDIKEIVEALSDLNNAATAKNKAKDNLDAYLDAHPIARALSDEKEVAYEEYRSAKSKMMRLVQEYVLSNPEDKPSEVKERFNGIGFKRSRDLEYVGGLSTSKGKSVLHEWLVQHGEWVDGAFCVRVGDRHISSPVKPVVKVTPTVPSEYK